MRCVPDTLSLKCALEAEPGQVPVRRCGVPLGHLLQRGERVGMHGYGGRLDQDLNHRITVRFAPRCKPERHGLEVATPPDRPIMEGVPTERGDERREMLPIPGILGIEPSLDRVILGRRHQHADRPLSLPRKLRQTRHLPSPPTLPSRPRQRLLAASSSHRRSLGSARSRALPEDRMSTAELTARELATRFYEAFDAGDLDAVLSLLGRT
jgi:hypothetical protein